MCNDCKTPTSYHLNSAYNRVSIINQSNQINQMKTTAIALMGLLVMGFSANEMHAVNGNGVETVFSKNSTPICNAIAKGDIATVLKFIEYGSDLNERGANGMTPLMYAARYNQAEIVKVLLQKGAKVNLKSDAGLTALHYAERSNAQSCIELLKA